MSVKPLPQSPHKPSPSDEKDHMDPYRSLCLICILGKDLVEFGDIDIVVSTTSEIISFDEAETVHHDVYGTNNDSHRHEDGDCLVYQILIYFHLSEQAQLLELLLVRQVPS